MPVKSADTIEVYNLLGTRLRILEEIYDVHIEHEIDSWDTLIFSVPGGSPYLTYLKNEHRVKYKGQLYVIKKVGAVRNEKGILTQEVTCPSIASDLNSKVNQVVGEYYDKELLPVTLNGVEWLDLLLQNTGWTRGSVTVDLNKRRAYSSEWQSVPNNLLEIKKRIGGYVVYRPLELKVDLLDEPGEMSGLTFQYGKNMRSQNRDIDSTEFVTRLYCYGSENLTFNEINPTHQSYIEDYSYFLGLGYTQEQIDADILANGEASVFVRVGQFVDEEYVEAQALYDDGLKKLQEELCKPKVSYSGAILDLSIFPEYKHEKFKLGDWITIIDPDLGTVDCRIVKLVEYPDSPDKMTMDLTNFKDTIGNVLTSTIAFTNDLMKNPQVTSLKKHVIDTFATTINSAQGSLKWSDDTFDAVELDDEGNRTGRVVRISPGGIGISNDGGQTFEQAMTGEGLLASIIYADALHILGIGSDGIVIEEGTNGVRLNNTEGLVITNANKLLRTILNATLGIAIQQGDGSGTTSSWHSTFYADGTGELYLEGSVKAKSFKNRAGDELLTEDTLKIKGAYIDQIVADQIKAGKLILDNVEDISSNDGNVRITKDGIFVDQGRIEIKDREGNKAILNAFGIDTSLFKYMKNMVFNSSFELFDSATGATKYWTGGVSVSSSSLFDTHSMKIEPGVLAEYTPIDGNGRINSSWYADEASAGRTVVALYRKGGAIRVRVKNQITGNLYPLTSFGSSAEPSTTIDVPAKTNWIDSRIILYFEHGDSSIDTDIRILIENIDSVPVYIDGIQLEADISGMWPSAYFDGPDSLSNGSGLPLGTGTTTPTEPEDPTYDDPISYIPGTGIPLFMGMPTGENIPTSFVYIDPENYSRYDVMTTTQSITLIQDSPEVILANPYVSSTITITLPATTTEGRLFKIYNIGTGMVAITPDITHGYGVVNKLFPGESIDVMYLTGWRC